MPNAPFDLFAPVVAAYTNGANSAPEWFPAAFPFFFAGMWILVTTVLGWIAGHMALLARYPPAEESKEETFGWTSGSMRGVSFNSALYVGLGTRGLHLAPNALFRPIFRRGIPCMHPVARDPVGQVPTRRYGAVVRGIEVRDSSGRHPFRLERCRGPGSREEAVDPSADE
jgi:hypothetical protein